MNNYSSLYQAIKAWDTPNNKQLCAIHFKNHTISYHKMIQQIQKMASFFKGLGVKEGDVVTVSLPNVPQTIYAFYALDMIGAIQNIIHPLTPLNKIIESMEKTNSHVGILNEMVYQNNIDRFEKTRDIFIFVNPMSDVNILMKHLFYTKYRKARTYHNKHLKRHIYHMDEYKQCKGIEEDHSNGLKNSIYLHSGGTTGNPKVIALSDQAINNLAAKVNDIIGGSIKGMGMLAVLPLFHGFGLGMGVHAPLANGCSTCIEMKFDVKETLKWIDKGIVNLMIGVPALYNKLLKDDDLSKTNLTRVKVAFVGGDNVPPSLLKTFNETMDSHGSQALLMEGYGLTETVTVCSVNTLAHHKEGSIGRMLTGLKAMVLDEQGQSVPNGTVGELYVSGNTMMNGYLGDPEATHKTLVEINKEIWVKTGDLAYQDDEDYLFFKSRIKRLFIIAGYNVYPSEIEKIASDREEIKAAALEYFTEPHSHLNLYLIRKPSAKSDDALRNEIMDDLKNNVLKFSLPSHIIFMESFPETTVGKINHQGFKDIE